MTRMMKIVPARRLVSDASFESPNIARNRPIRPGDRGRWRGWSVRYGHGKDPRAAREAASIGPSNDSLRFGWIGPCRQLVR